jgi:hydrogenase/urease accessory protein HupE
MVCPPFLLLPIGPAFGPLTLGHLTPTGLGPWGDGMAQLLLQPTEGLLPIALVLLAAQSGRSVCDRLPLLLPVAWLVGGLIGLGLPGEHSFRLATTVLLLLAGLVVILGWRLPQRILVPLITGFSLVGAVAAGSSMAGHPGALASLLGETVALAVLVFVLAQALAPPHPPWLAIVLRVAGSWISATALLMLAWLLRHPA